MIDSIIQNNKKKEPQYPLLKISKHGMVVLFTSEREGTVIYQGGGATKFGTSSKDFNPNLFVEFDGKVILTNKK